MCANTSGNTHANRPENTHATSLANANPGCDKLSVCRVNHSFYDLLSILLLTLILMLTSMLMLMMMLILMLMLKFGHDFQKFGQDFGAQVWSRLWALPSDQLQQYLHQLLCIFKRVMLHVFLIENSLLTKT